MTRYDFRLERLATPTGPMRLVTDEEGRLRLLDWDDRQARMERLIRLHYGHSVVLADGGGAPSAAARAVEGYFGGDLTAIEALATRTAGTPFQREVWAALRAIPLGQTLSYGALAARIGRPKAVRAVGLANGANPIGIVVPCHRVIGADASMTGFGGGIERKRWLLRHEGAIAA